MPNASGPARAAWEDALNGHECSSSIWVCMEHFTPNDLIVYKNGDRVVLRAGAIPSVFNVYVEVSDDQINETDSYDVNINRRNLSNQIHEVNEIQELRLRKEKLILAIEQMKSKNDSDMIVMNIRINTLKEDIKQQLNQIKDLKKQIEVLNKSIDQMQKEIELTFDEMNLRILIDFNHRSIFEYFYICLFYLFYRRNKNKSLHVLYTN